MQRKKIILVTAVIEWMQNNSVNNTNWITTLYKNQPISLHKRQLALKIVKFLRIETQPQYQLNYMKTFHLA